MALVSAVVAAAGLVVAVLALVQSPSPGTIHDRGSLPQRLGLCGRTYVRGRGILTLAAITKDIGAAQPPIVEPSLFTACPRSPRDFGLAPADVWTAVFVRVGQDEYVSYGLQGGP